MTNRALVSAFRLTKSLSHPYHVMRSSRIGVVNRYKWVSSMPTLLTLVLLYVGLCV